jgi:hypothetical protein
MSDCDDDEFVVVPHVEDDRVGKAREDESTRDRADTLPRMRVALNEFDSAENLIEEVLAKSCLARIVPKYCVVDLDPRASENSYFHVLGFSGR